MFINQTISTPAGTCGDFDLSCVMRTWVAWNAGHLFAPLLVLVFIGAGGIALTAAFSIALRVAPSVTAPTKTGNGGMIRDRLAAPGRLARAGSAQADAERGSTSDTATLTEADPAPAAVVGNPRVVMRQTLIHTALYLSGLVVIALMMPATLSLLDGMGFWKFLGATSAGLTTLGKGAVIATAAPVLVHVVRFVIRQKERWLPVLYPVMLLVVSCILAISFGTLGAIVNSFGPTRENLTYFGDPTTTTISEQPIIPESIKITHPDVGWFISRTGPAVATGLATTSNGSESFVAEHVEDGNEWTLKRTRTCQPVLYASWLLDTPDTKISDYCTESNTAVIEGIAAAH